MMKKTLILLLALSGAAMAGISYDQMSDADKAGLVYANDFSTADPQVNNISLSAFNKTSEGGAALVTSAAANSPFTLNQSANFGSRDFSICFDVNSIASNTTSGDILTLYSNNVNGANLNYRVNIEVSNGNVQVSQAKFASSTTTTQAITLGSKAEIAGTIIAVVFDSSESTITTYVDGVSKGILSLVNCGSATTDTLCALQFGKGFGKNQQPLNGDGAEIDNVYFWNRALSAEEIARVAPEPATATLSLLALAGLAARRRRH